MGLFDIFSGKSAKELKAAGLQAQQQLYGAGNAAQNTFNAAGANAQRDFTALGSGANAGYGNVASQAGAMLDQGSAAALPYYDQARAEYAGLGFAPDQYGGTLRSGYGALADATGANGAAGLERARVLFTATPGYQEGLDRAVNEATRVANARGVAIGNSLADTTKLATGYANQGYGDFVNRLSPFANAPTTQLARDSALANFATQIAGARAGLDVGTGQALSSAANTKASLVSGLQGRGLDLASQLQQQGANLAFQGTTGGAQAALGAQTAGTQANLQAQQQAVQAENAANAAAWSALLGGANLGLKAFGVGGFAPGGK
jgi:hypothetical protein